MHVNFVNLILFLKVPQYSISLLQLVQFKCIFYRPLFGQYIGRLVLKSPVILARYENDCETHLLHMLK